MGEGTLNLDTLLEPGNRYILGDRLGSGVCGDVFEATDSQAGGRRVAIKIQRAGTLEELEDASEEYYVLKELATHPNLPEFYGVFVKRGSRPEDIRVWFVMEFCEGGPATDLVQGLLSQNKKMSEVHIAYILRETVKALVHLHENNVIHRDVRGSNILLTKNGEVKLCDFGLSRRVAGEMGKRHTVLGSPCWVAPEVVTSDRSESEGYDIRADIWSLGITAIELGDGKAPFINIHPTRALFQIVRNPPPTLYRPANWTQNYNDFIAECLVKNPEHRPFSVEVIEHPFLTSLPSNEFLLQQDLKTLTADLKGVGKPFRKPEVTVRGGCLQAEQGTAPEHMFTEDLAALDVISEDAILEQLHQRLKRGLSHTFIGDILLFLNPNEQQNIYGPQHHAKYSFKALSDNAPHVFAIADRAFQDMMHHEEPQHILLAGESLSGKTTNFGHLVKHLIHLGQSGNNAGNRIEKSLEVVHAMGNAATPLNRNSTRHVLHLEVTFGGTGKCSGAIFWVFQLERWRVTSNDRDQGNFHYFYYFFAGMEESGQLYKYGLEPGGGGISRYRYLRSLPKSANAGSLVGEFDLGTSNEGVSTSTEVNAQRWKRFVSNLKDHLDFEPAELQTLYNVTAAIILLGEIRFREVLAEEGSEEKSCAEIENPDVAVKVASLLGVDDKKLSWALVNYCFVDGGKAQRRRHSKMEAEEARDALARATYARLFDWMINTINHRLSFTRAVFGDKHCVTILDLFGFECFQKNSIEQLFVNALNEQLQYHYNQRVFVWEMQECEEEEMKTTALTFYDNKPALDALMGKPDGVLHCIDEATRTDQGTDFILGTLRNAAAKGPHVRVGSGAGCEFSVAHYTGKVSYEVTDMAEKNRDFVPPETIDTMRQSTDPIIKSMFTNPLSRTGNLTVTGGPTAEDEKKKEAPEGKKKGRRWGALLMAENTKTRTYNTEIRGQYSQTRKMRTAAAIYRATCLELLRGFSSSPSVSLPANGESSPVSSGGASTLFIRCIRPSISDAPRTYQTDVVRQQLRALAVTDTARARQSGFSHRILFHEFLRRYKFLAFDFDETVEMNKDNSRLLLVRLKMEGWDLGKTKVFLKYYNEEYLSRLYEIQVKKIVKVQSMMRAFLAKRNVKVKKQSSVAQEDAEDGKGKKAAAKNDGKDMTEEEAATRIQSIFRGNQTRKVYKVVTGSKDLDEVTVNFIREYCHRWKAKSIFQVLLHYRAARRHDLVYLAQQVHLYNQFCVSGLQECRKEVSLSSVEAGLSRLDTLPRPSVSKLPFRLIDNPHFWDTSPLCDPSAAGDLADDTNDWDAPLRRNEKGRKKNTRDQEVQTGENTQGRRVSISHTQAPFCRYPNSMFTGYTPPQSAQATRNTRKDFRGTAPNKPAPPPPPVASRNRFEPSYAHSTHFMDNDGSGTLSVSERRNMFSNDMRSGPSPAIREQQKKFNGGSGENSMGDTKASSKPLFEELVGAKGADSKGEDTDSNTPLETDEENNLAKSIDELFGDMESTADASPPKKLPLDRPVNPVYEMEMKARRGEQQTEDGPPFNFQGMLRKTNYCRGSLKRSPGDDFGLPNSSYNSYSAKKWDEREGGGQSYSNNNHSSYNRIDNEPVNNYKPSRPRRSSDKWKQPEDTNVHQLAPGIVLEGQEEEL